MKRVPIKSSSDEADPRPWADLDLTDGSLVVGVKALNGLPPFRERNGLGADVPPGWKKRPNKTSHTFVLSTDATVPTDDDGNPTGPAPKDEVHVLAVTLDGDLEFVPQSQQQPVYYAHLAWYDPAAGEWTALEFTE